MSAQPRPTESGQCPPLKKLRGAEKNSAMTDLTQRLKECGVYERYIAWSSEYVRWRQGKAHGARGEAPVVPASNSEEQQAKAWRDKYRRWRCGFAAGARGETSDAKSSPLAALLHDGDVVEDLVRDAPAVVYDVCVGSDGSPELVPVDGPPTAPVPVRSFPNDALVTIRTFRFFEDRSDEKEIYEQELHNVNSGSLLWLPVHLEPGMHSVRGAKYGTWFTIHYVQIYAKHFSSAYHMANEGVCLPAKTFGSTAALTKTIQMKQLQSGYFWYVSPTNGSDAIGSERLKQLGWKHVCRAGPYNGGDFLVDWKKKGSPMETRKLQQILHSVTKR